MRFKIYSLLLALLFSSALVAQTPGWQWVRTVGGTGGGGNDGNSIARDRDGNLYVTGTYASQTITFGTTVLNINGYSDAFLAKYDALGNVLWARSIGSGGYDKGIGVGCDTSGNVYVAGMFGESPVYLDTDTLYSNAAGDNMFVAKYNSNGEIQWSENADAENVNRTGCMAVDAAGNVYISGIYLGNNLTFGTTTLPFANGLGAMYIAKYNTDGDVVWAAAADGTGYDRPQGITADDFGNVYLTGTTGSAKIAFTTGDTLDNTGLVGGLNIFLVKFNASGSLSWKKANKYSSGEGLGLCTGKPDELYLSGFFAGDSLQFDTISLVGGAHNAFIVKYDSAGHALWAREGQGSEFDYGNNVASDKHGMVYLCGYFSSPTIIFDTITITKNGTVSSTNTDLFTAAYDSAGNLQWVVTAGASNPEMLNGVVAGDNGEVFVAGSAQSPSFNAGSIGVTTHGHDVFIGKIGPLSSGVGTVTTRAGVAVYPNPSSGNIIVNVPAGTTDIQIVNMVGQVLQTIPVKTQKFIPISFNTTGMYFIRVTTATATLTQKVVVK